MTLALWYFIEAVSYVFVIAFLMSAVAAAGFKTKNVLLKKCSKLGKTAILSWGSLL